MTRHPGWQARTFYAHGNTKALGHAGTVRVTSLGGKQARFRRAVAGLPMGTLGACFDPTHTEVGYRTGCRPVRSSPKPRLGPEAVDAPHPLFHVHGIPRHVDV